MRTDTPQPIRLSDYSPPAFLIDEIKLDFQLDPHAMPGHIFYVRRHSKREHDFDYFV